MHMSIHGQTEPLLFHMQNSRHKQGINKGTVKAIFFFNKSVPSDKHNNGQYSKTRIQIIVENKIQIQEAIAV